MEFTKDEKLALEEFRPRVIDLLPPSRANDDLFLIRWLRARELDLNKAEKMLQKCIEWRDIENPEACLQYKASDEIEKNLQWTFSGFDNQGRPVLVVPFGDWEIRKFIEAGKREECVLQTRRLLEEIRLSIENIQSSGVTQFVTVMDSAGLTFWKIAHLETVNAVLAFFREFEAYYPETLHSCYIINAPWVFPYIFNLVKPLLSMRTLGKVQIFDSGSKWRKTLNHNLPVSAIPSQYATLVGQ